MFVPESLYPSHLPKRLPTVKADGRYVSVASIFKELQPRPKRKRGASKGISSVIRRKVVDAGVQNLRRIKSSSNGRSPNNGLGRHRLEYAFKESTQTYRTHVYTNVIAKINNIQTCLQATLSDVTGKLFTHHTPSSNPTSSLSKLQILQNPYAMSGTMGTRPSNYILEVTSTDKYGEKTKFTETMDDRFTDYTRYIAREEQALKDLQKQWEFVVAEIWKLGLEILGKDIMSATLEPSVTSSSSTLSEPNINNGRNLSSMGEKPRKKNKSVSFADPIPTFLTDPSRSPHPVAMTPEFPEEKAKALGTSISRLGAEELAGLKKVDKEFNAWWGTYKGSIVTMAQQA